MQRDVYNMNDNREKETVIECVGRRYRVNMPGGIVTEVESTKPLSRQMNRDLLEEDNEIGSFFSNYKITSVRHVVTPMKNDVKHEEIVNKHVSDKKMLTPRQRINALLKMSGEFTRDDYQKYMLDAHGVKIAKFMAYDDIRDAIKVKRLILTGEKSGRAKTYKVVDAVEVDEQLYKTIIKEHKAHMEMVQ